MSKGNAHEPIPLDEALRRLGFDWSLERLRRTLLAFERRHGVTLMHRAGGSHKFGTRYVVTMDALRRSFPDWFVGEEESESLQRATEIADIIADEIRGIREASEEHGWRIAKLADSLGRLWKRLVAIEGSKREQARASKSARRVKDARAGTATDVVTSARTPPSDRPPLQPDTLPA